VEEIDKPENPIACAFRRTDRRTDIAKERGGHEARREDEERRREE
jgi:hypothetical protein